ncbi:hypothetical protein GCM10023200_46210 [Actinomycetospora chlora]|uniref:Carboxypeptidase regulatory-like domain-containing protein n=1 Tax=Actinomycetospora chlora TaxID=663608 RepID=A0ABP9C3W2_9PSEU
MSPTRTRPHPAAVVAVAVLVMVIAALLWRSDLSGTGARNVGGTGSPVAIANGTSCPPTITNPGGRNNYRAGAPLDAPMGTGFVVTGVVRDTACRPLPGVRVQVWLQTATAGERDHRTSVLTGPDGRYRVDSDPMVAQFGEPNVHVAHDGAVGGAEDGWRSVWQRHVLDDGDTSATVDLVLVPA